MVGTLWSRPSTGLVMRYRCAKGMIGRRSPTMRAMSLPHWPAALTTTSHLMVPRLVTTSSTWPFLVMMAVTVVSVKMRAPRALAPAARAVVSMLGSIDPSVGVSTAPSTPSEFMRGKSFWASAVLIISSGMPNERA